MIEDFLDNSGHQKMEIQTNADLIWTGVESIFVHPHYLC